MTDAPRIVSEPNGTVTVRLGKVELGQGILTALAQIAADELGVPFDRVRIEPANTVTGPDEGITAGSMSIQNAGPALRKACAEARPAVTPEAGVVGTDVPRLDLPDKVAGRPRFIHDLVLDGQLHGRVVRPPSPAATLADVDTAAAHGGDGVTTVVRDGSFLGVVATTERAADRAAAALRDAATWSERDSLPDEDDLAGYLRAGPHETTVLEDADVADTPPVAHRLAATYNKPFLAHASMAPSCAVARWRDDDLTVWSHTQGVYPLRGALAMALDLPDHHIAVHHVEGAGCYGHNGADDVALDAALLARAVPGRPVRVRWSRADELTWAPFGSAMSIDVEAGVDEHGRIVTWSHDVWSQGHTSRPGTAGHGSWLLASAHVEDGDPLPPAADPRPTSGSGSARNAVPLYTFAHRQVRSHRLVRTALRSSAMRSLGAFANVFAIESFVDEIAATVGSDPLDLRLAHLDDPRARTVLTTAADAAGWGVRPVGESTGRGLGFARYKNTGAYCAVVAEVEAVHDVRVRRLTVAVDAGQVVNPDGVRNQLAGGAVQATSWTLKERVRFDRRRVRSADWESYPILTFREAPEIDVHVVDAPDAPSVGCGEAAQGPTAAAIGNAVADALGVRVRDLPITSARVIAAFG